MSSAAIAYHEQFSPLVAALAERLPNRNVELIYPEEYEVGEVIMKIDRSYVSVVVDNPERVASDSDLLAAWVDDMVKQIQARGK